MLKIWHFADDENLWCQSCGAKFGAGTCAFLRQAIDFYKRVPRSRCAYFLDRVSFDSDKLALNGICDEARHWVDINTTDRVSLEYLPNRPAISADPAEIGEMRALFRNMAAGSGGTILGVDSVQVQRCNTLRVIQKLPQKPAGMSNTGILMLPLRDFGYAFRVDCSERRTTGLRDTAVFTELLHGGELKFDAGMEQAIGGMADPYDASIAAALARNRSEDPVYDLRFPDHPLSRLRRLMQHIQATVRLARTIRNAAK